MEIKFKLSDEDYVIIHGSPKILFVNQIESKIECIAKDDKFQITKPNISVLQRSVYRFSDFEGE